MSLGNSSPSGYHHHLNWVYSLMRVSVHVSNVQTSAWGRGEGRWGAPKRLWLHGDDFGRAKWHVYLKHGFTGILMQEEAQPDHHPLSKPLPEISPASPCLPLGPCPKVTQKGLSLGLIPTQSLRLETQASTSSYGSLLSFLLSVNLRSGG